MMRRLMLLAAVLVLSVPAIGKPLTLYVAPSVGNDSWTGTRQNVAAKPGDGPLATLEGARDRLRSLAATGNLPVDGAVVNLMAGDYRRNSAFVLTSADDFGARPVIYQAYNQQTVRIDGGQAIGGWFPVTDPAILARLDPSARSVVRVANLKAQDIDNYGDLASRDFSTGGPYPPASSYSAVIDR